MAKYDSNEEEIKMLCIRVPKDMWIFCKKKTTDREMSVNALINELLYKYRNKVERI
jgi:hypothetical protein